MSARAARVLLSVNTPPLYRGQGRRRRRARGALMSATRTAGICGRLGAASDRVDVEDVEGGGVRVDRCGEVCDVAGRDEAAAARRGLGDDGVGEVDDARVVESVRARGREHPAGCAEADGRHQSLLVLGVFCELVTRDAKRVDAARPRERVERLDDCGVLGVHLGVSHERERRSDHIGNCGGGRQRRRWRRGLHLTAASGLLSVLEEERELLLHGAEGALAELQEGRRAGGHEAAFRVEDRQSRAPELCGKLDRAAEHAIHRVAEVGARERARSGGAFDADADE